MEKIIKKIYTKDKGQLIKDILYIYETKRYLVVDFIYFASFYKYVLKLKDISYITSLVHSNILLPDGIALKTYLKKKFHIDTFNLNWTDFTPYFLNQVLTEQTHIAFYTVYDEKIWKKEEDVEIVKTYIKDNFKFKKLDAFVSHYSKRWEDFDFKHYKQSLKEEKFDKKIFLVGIWTPFQEKWVQEHIDFFQENSIIVMNVWGLFDFWAGFEKRAPKLIRKTNLEWAWRFIQNPKKNFNKVLDSFNLFQELIKK